MQTDLRQAIGPLRLVFWGAIVCILDFKINGFDIINDVIGTAMVAWGVNELAGLNDNPQYQKYMKFVRICSFIAIGLSLRNQLSIDLGHLQFVLTLLQVLTLLGTYVFCLAMEWLCQSENLDEPSQSWKLTGALWGLIYVIPLGLFYLSSIYFTLTGQNFSYQLNSVGAALILFAVFAIPIVHLMISIHRTKNAIETREPFPT